jgi:tetratricopeptide (TPR) repeat protein
MLDVLEEVMFHMVEAGRGKDAWSLYWSDLGGWIHLRPLGEHRRVERICRLLAAGHPPESPVSTRNAPQAEAAFLAEWSHALAIMGDLETSLRCSEASLKRDGGANACRNYLGIAHTLFLQGRLGLSLQALDQGVQIADKNHYEEELDALARGRYFVCTLIGDIVTADRCWRAIESGGWRMVPVPCYWQHAIGERRGRPATVRCFPSEQALALAQRAFECGDRARARAHAEDALRLATRRDEPDPLCRTRLVLAILDMADAGSMSNGTGDVDALTRAQQHLDDGFRIAVGRGYGLQYIDLLIARAGALLIIGESDGAEDAARAALYGRRRAHGTEDPYAMPALDETSAVDDRGVLFPPGSGRCSLLAATHPDCAYAWGAAEASTVLAEALLLRAGQLLQQPTFRKHPTKFWGSAQLPPPVEALVTGAKGYLQQAQKLWQKLDDPRQHRIRDRLVRLERSGELTRYPLCRPRISVP